jgi:CHAT domain-containing protein/tetratricopeptide (TPR) repeat protein
MNSARKMRIVAWLGFALLAAAAARAQTGPLADQIAQHEQKLAAAREAKSTKDETTELNVLGLLCRQAGKMQKGLDYLNEALPIERSENNRAGQAMTENAMGRIYADLGQEEKALALFDQALAVWRELGLRQVEANTLNYIGKAHNNLGQREQALKDLNEALAIWRDLGSGQGSGRTMSGRDRMRNMGQLSALKEMNDAMPNWRETAGRAGEASTLDNLGKTYSDMGQSKEAFKYFNQALPIWREAGERGGEALTLNNMGRAYADLGRKQKSLEAYNQALDIWRALGNRQGEALTLNNIGRLYRDLAQQQTALDYYNQALPVWREAGSRNGEALALNDIGRAYADLGQPQKALDYCGQALPIWRETGNRRGEATTLNNMGRDYFALGEPDKALELDNQALPIWREVEDRRGEALALMTIGWAYSALNQKEKALASELAALSLAKAAGDPGIEGGIENTLMIGFRKEHRSEEAIFFGTEAVNSYQQIRKNIEWLDKALQTGFVQSKSATYRTLAELLVEAGRLGEAEQVLDLLKEQELKEVVRGASENAAGAEPLKLNGAQQKAESDLEAAEKLAVALTGMSAEYAALLAKAARTPEEEARLKTLEAKIEAANGEVSDFFRKTLYPELAQKAGTQDANALLSKEKSEVSRLQNTLAGLGPHVMGIRLLLGDEHAYAIVVTAQARKKFELQATPAELRGKVLEARDALRTPGSDPRPHQAELYAMTVAPLEGELNALERSNQENGRVPTLLWSLDGVMRYLPMAALYDGHRYMVERFNNVLFTPESYGHMTASAGANQASFRVLAMGLSKSYGGLPALPGVMPELDAVARDPAVPESHGPMDGILLPNDRFTYAALKTELGAGSTFPVVHIASHFVLESGSGTEPYLMLGGETAGDPEGFPLTLSRLEDSTVSFHGTRLLTLSACSTAKGDVAKDGLEMDSLGMIAQQKDAEAVLATLWDVNDASTSRIMSDFYARWVNNPAGGKAEALRQAQLAFLRGPTASTQGGSGRGIQTVEDSTPASPEAGYSHPFYWAPFVLIGNYQ